MNTKAIANEFAKMRRLRVAVIVSVLVVGIVGVALYSSVPNPDFVVSSPNAWNSLLGGLSSAMTLFFPLLLAVLASRQVDIEHQGNGWLLSATSGVTAGNLCRAKLVALGAIVIFTTVLTSLIILGIGLLLGVAAPVPLDRWGGFTVAIIVVNLVVLALHIVLSAKVDNQLVSIGIGLLGLICAMFGSSVPTWLAHLTPWGYYALSAPAGYQEEKLIALMPSYVSIAILGIVGIVLFLLITDRLDRQEV